MSIGVDCPGCQTSFQVDPKHAGKLGQCPHCRERVRVPHLKPAAPPVARPIPTGRAEPPVKPRPIIDLDDDGEQTYGLASEAATIVAARVRAAKAARVQAIAAAQLGSGDAPAMEPQVRPSGRHFRTPREILAGFRGAIEPVRPTSTYRAWIGIIAVVMVLLPLVYLGLVAAVASAVCWHATHNHVIFQSGGGHKLAVILYFAPIVAGVVVVAFMLKPLFARSGKQAQVRKLNPAKEPLLFAFVEGICDAVGAPMPTEIEVDCDVNAGARLVSWVFSPSRRLVLRIGLPLVAGLSLRQLTGVLAHEFGHFSQGAGMRLTVLVRTINLWFARVVYERDAWDQTLIRWSTRDAGVGIILGLVIQAAVWFTRRVLWVLMHVGHLVSGFMSRQMEFDADRYETRMVGTKTFEATAVRLSDLGLAWQAAHNDLAAHWRERRLPDDLAKLLMLKDAEFSPEVRKAVRAEALARTTGLFDTHPCDSERIASSRLENSRGIFKLDGPASELFRDFEALSRAATFEYYKAQLGPSVTPGQLYPVAEAILNREVEREGNQAIDRFFLAAWQMVQPIALPDTYPPAIRDPKAAKRRLGDLRRTMLARRQVNLELGERWGKAAGRAFKADAAIAMFRADKAVRAAVVDLPKATLRAAETAREQAQASTDYIEGEFAEFSQLAAERIALALGLLELDLVVARVPDGVVLRDEARALYPAASLLGGRVVPELGQVLIALGALGFLFSQFQAGKNDKDQAMINALLRGGRKLHDRLTSLKWKVGDLIAYPFEHAQAGITLGRYALPNLPPAEALGDLFQTGTEAQDRLIDLHRRVLGRLAATAEAVERAIGLPPVEITAPQEEEILDLT